MAAADYIDEVQSVYLAYYGRPADTGGLAYWSQQLNDAGGDLNRIIDAFANSPEANTLYGASTVVGRVQQVYAQLLGRAPEQGGLDYWVGEIEAGRKSLANLALDVLYGAQNQDAQTIQSRLQVAEQFTQKLGAMNINYSGDDAAAFARNFLSNVTSDGTTLQQALQNMDGMLGQLDTISDEWDNAHSGGGDDSGFVPEELAALVGILTLNQNGGGLSTEALRSGVMAQTGEASYYHLFNPGSFDGADDGTWSVEDLGFSSLGALPATAATLESLFYGTMIRTIKALDEQEIQALDDFAVNNAAALEAMDQAVVQTYLGMVLDAYADEANPPLLTDDQIATAMVMTTAGFVGMAQGQDSFNFFEGLVLGF